MVGTGIRKESTMYNFEYVPKKEAEPYRELIKQIIHEVQNLVRDKFTFRYDFIGSSSRNMITFDSRTNIGFDFDINIEVNDYEQKYSAKEIKELLMSAFNKVAPRKGLGYCEDSTRVFTIKKVNSWASKIEYSFDFAIVNSFQEDNGEWCQEYIRYNKKQNSYAWELQPHPYYLDKKVDWIKYNNLWEDVLELYLIKKNNNTDKNKKSRSIYAETIHQICQQNGYYK